MRSTALTTRSMLVLAWLLLMASRDDDPSFDGLDTPSIYGIVAFGSSRRARSVDAADAYEKTK